MIDMGIGKAGWAELRVKFRTIPPSDAESLRASRAGAKVIADAIRKTAPVGPTGNLRKRVGVAHKPKKTATGPVIEAGSFAPHSHLNEFGSRPRFHKGGRFTGAMPASGFVRRAVASSSPAAEAVIGRIIVEGVERRASR